MKKLLLLLTLLSPNLFGAEAKSAAAAAASGSDVAKALPDRGTENGTLSDQIDLASLLKNMPVCPLHQRECTDCTHTAYGITEFLTGEKDIRIQLQNVRHPALDTATVFSNATEFCGKLEQLVQLADDKYAQPVVQDLFQHTTNSDSEIYLIYTYYSSDIHHMFSVEKKDNKFRVFHSHIFAAFTLSEWLGFTSWPDNTQADDYFAVYGKGQWVDAPKLLRFTTTSMRPVWGLPELEAAIRLLKWYHIKKFTLDPERLKKLAAAGPVHPLKDVPDAKENPQASAGAGAGS